MEQREAERALDTMSLLCAGIDADTEAELRTIYREVRGRAEKKTAASTGIAQPAPESKRGALTEGNLLEKVGTKAVQKTKLTRKVTYGGKTVVYPVYRVRVDKLYYNDQNDRIATRISQYESENGKDSFEGLDRVIYNRIIENFVCESNPDSIFRTQKNISLVGQREPGVTLADGRVVDGNRRFTCLRRIQRESPEPVYFETVIMDMDIREDKKQIKLLELAIQHGEEKKVDYDLIDYAIGTYRDIVQTKLLTIEEYAANANESAAEVRRRLENAGLICEFLEYIRLPEQYHVAREYQMYNLVDEMGAPLKQLNDEEKSVLKKIAFNNVILKAVPDQRKFIRDIRTLIRSDSYKQFFEEQIILANELSARYDDAEINSKDDVDKFASDNSFMALELKTSLENALQRSRADHLRAKPAENVSKCISLLMDIDPRLFEKLDPEEKGTLMAELDELKKITDSFKNML